MGIIIDSKSYIGNAIISCVMYLDGDCLVLWGTGDSDSGSRPVVITSAFLCTRVVPAATPAGYAPATTLRIHTGVSMVVCSGIVSGTGNRTARIITSIGIISKTCGAIAIIALGIGLGIPG